MEIVDKNKNTLYDDKDCTNNKIYVEECINKKNRYFPNAPPEVDLNKYQNLVEDRLQSSVKESFYIFEHL
jgi:hypothetical protein